ncbi:MAG: hypothetical protein IJZ56_03340 [Oscillospiraceae bacterium]|nr:hypothetical protein [Oscillospiraceae bacterium]
MDIIGFGIIAITTAACFFVKMNPEVFMVLEALNAVAVLIGYAVMAVIAVRTVTVILAKLFGLIHR